MVEGPKIAWAEVEPEVLKRERDEMERYAPDMVFADDLIWRDDRRALGWVGQAPAWGGDRDKPVGVDELLGGRRLRLIVVYTEAFPLVPARLLPTDPEVPPERRTMHKWHVNGDGSLCLMQSALDWSPSDTAADLVRKASGWFVEYLLVEAGKAESMTERGIFDDRSLDSAIAEYSDG